MADGVVWVNCKHCTSDKPVAMRENRSGLAYGQCYECGVKVQHTLKRVSDKLMAAIRGDLPEKKAVEAPEKVGDLPKKPDAPSVKSAAPGKPVAPRKAGGLAGLLGIGQGD